MEAFYELVNELRQFTLLSVAERVFRLLLPEVALLVTAA